MIAGPGVGRSVRLLALGPLFYLGRSPGVAVLLMILILLLTVLTQVGGVLLWVWLPVADLAARAVPGPRAWRRLVAAGSFLPVYLLASILLIPPLAAPFGRVPLPCWRQGETAYEPLTRATCLTNRHYATPAARAALAAAAGRLPATAPGRRLSYLDAGYPFFSWFPMLPHLSHNDGRRIDLALLFLDPATGRPVPGRAPSPIGYWGYVQPRPGEAGSCDGQPSPLRWNLDWLQPALPKLGLDETGLRALLDALTGSDRVARVLVEPHLSRRVGITHAKIRFQGCAAARHDDHVHVEFR